MGCLLIGGEPEVEAVAEGLVGMQRTDGVFTPVLPLSREQAAELLRNESTLYETVDPATAIISVAASRKPITKAVVGD